MSSASVPAPRSGPSSSGPRYSVFWPILIYLVGAGLLSFYHIMSLESQLDETVRATDKLDVAVKHADYEKDKYFAFARDLVRLAPKDAAAEQIVQQAGLRRLQETQPVLMSLQISSGFTNTAPVDPNALPDSPETTNAATLPGGLPAR